jgi:hypothetical protein
VNGVQVRPSVFIIGGNNFFRLRDLGDMIGFTVGYDETTQTVLLTTK